MDSPEWGWCANGNNSGFGFNPIQKNRRAKISATIMIWAMIFMGCGWMIP